MKDFMPGEIWAGGELAFEGKEEHTEGIGDTTSREEREHEGSEAEHERLQGDEDEPTHEEIEEEGESRVEAEIKEFDGETDKGQSPNNAKERPTPRHGERHKEDRGIGASDEHRDERMVEPPGPGFGARPKR